MKKNIFDRLTTNKLIWNAMKLSSSNIVLYLIPLIVTPVLSRLYSLELFGEWGVFSSTFTILSVILFGCYEFVIIKAQKQEIIYICTLCILVAGSIITLSTIIFYVGTLLQISFFSDFPSPGLFISYMIISVGLVILQNLANREGKYSLLATSYMVTGISQAATRVLFGFFNLFSNGLIVGTVIAQLLGSVYLLLNTRLHHIKSFITNFNFRRTLDIAKKYKSFPLYDAPATLLAFAAFNLPTIILSVFYSRSDIGCFSIVIQMLLMPMSFIGSAIGKVYYEQISSSQNYNTTIKTKTLSIIKLTTYLSSFPTLFLVFGGDKLVVLFLGGKWELAGQIALCLTLWSIPTILTQPLISIYRVKEEQRKMLFYNAVYFIGSIGSILVGSMMASNILCVLIAFAIMGFTAKTIMFIDIMNITGVRYDEFPKGGLLTIVLAISGLIYRLCFL